MAGSNTHSGWKAALETRARRLRSKEQDHQNLVGITRRCFQRSWFNAVSCESEFLIQGDGGCILRYHRQRHLLDYAVCSFQESGN